MAAIIRSRFKMFVFFTLALGLILDQIVCGQIAPTNEVKLEASAPIFKDGLTKHLFVNCSFMQLPTSSFMTVISVILSKTYPGQGTNFREIADITSYKPATVDIKNNTLGAHVTGQLSANGPSFISFEWLYPTAEVEGVYKCVVNGMDRGGHPLADSATTEISAQQEVDMNILLLKIQEMDKAQDKLKEQNLKLISENSKLADQNSNLLSIVGNHTKELENLKSHQIDLTSRLNESKTAMTFITSTYNGHTYLLSKPITRDVAVADSVCRLFGGYLAEINDIHEWNFVSDFIYVKNTITEYQHIHLGVSEEGHTGKWTYLTSDTPAYLYWHPGQPNEAANHCVFLWNKGYTGMVDDACYAQDFARFLCEIPL